MVILKDLILKLEKTCFRLAVTLINYLHLSKSVQKDHSGVLIERVHYYTIVKEVRTIREGVLIQEGALTEVVRPRYYF